MYGYILEIRNKTIICLLEKNNFKYVLTVKRKTLPEIKNNMIVLGLVVKYENNEIFFMLDDGKNWI